jgi:hypothetical protein
MTKLAAVHESESEEEVDVHAKKKQKTVASRRGRPPCSKIGEVTSNVILYGTLTA